MMRHFKTIFLSCLLGLVLGSCRTGQRERDWTEAEVLAEIARVNDHWQLHYPPSPDACTDSALYHLGNMAAYQATGNRNYLRYSEIWAKRNCWQGYFLAYIDLYKTAPDEHKLADMRRLLKEKLSVFPVADDKCSAGTPCQLMPLLAGLYGVTGDIGYLDRLHTLFDTAKRLTHQPADTPLFTCDNSRMFASIALVIEEVPLADNHQSGYLQAYSSLAQTLQGSQRPDGSWCSLEYSRTAGSTDADYLTTAFIAYGYLWGISHGLPDSDTYRATAERAWNYLAVNLDRTSFTDGIIGAYLLAASEMAKLLRM